MANIERTNVLFLLTATVALEAEGESYRGKLGVAYVVLTRMGKHGDSISDIVFKPYAFSAWNSVAGRQMAIDSISEEMWRESEKDAASAFYGIEHDPTHGADHYLNEGLTRTMRGGSLPFWVLQLDKTVRIGQHTFYKTRKGTTK